MATTIEKLIKAIECLADKINTDVTADQALKFTQAATNSANAIVALKNVEHFKDIMLKK